MDGKPGKEHVAVIMVHENMEQYIDGNLKNLAGDATFFVCPQLFEQLFNIMADYKGVLVPIMHIAMTSKHHGLYQAVFQRISELYPSLKPEQFMSDYETAIAIGVLHAFPNCKIKGCGMHFATAVYKKFNALGLTPWIAKCNIVGRVLRKLMCLTFLPPSKIAEQIQFIRRESERIPNEDVRAQVLDFIENYIIKFWWKRIGPSRLGLFAVRDKTNNYCESLHSNMKRSMRVKSPRFYRFMSLLNGEIIEPALVKILQIDNGQRVTFPGNAKAQKMIG